MRNLGQTSCGTLSKVQVAYVRFTRFSEVDQMQHVFFPTCCGCKGHEFATAIRTLGAKLHGSATLSPYLLLHKYY